jgi:HAD superfamily hydrolase (TIGR01509 family)
VDSEALLKQAEVEELQKNGIDISINDCVRLFSGVSIDVATELFEKEFRRKLPENFFQRQIRNSLPLFREKLKPLMSNTTRALYDGGYAMCVASSSPRERVELCVDVTNLRRYFPSHPIFTRDQVARGKPAPDLFLFAAQQMGVAPAQCVVVEDAAAGIEAALVANMKVVGVVGGGHAQSAWYRENVRSYGIPVATTEHEVLQCIQSFFR